MALSISHFLCLLVLPIYCLLQYMEEMMKNPKMQEMLNNPEMLRSSIMNNPMAKKMFESNPEAAKLLNDPGRLSEVWIEQRILLSCSYLQCSPFPRSACVYPLTGVEIRLPGV